MLSRVLQLFNQFVLPEDHELVGIGFKVFPFGKIKQTIDEEDLLQFIFGKSFLSE